MGVTLSHVWLFVTPWTVALQALLSLEFSRQEYWSGLLFSTPGDLPDPGIKPTSLASPELAGGFFTIVVFIHLSSISVFVFIVTLTLILPSSLQLLAAVTISKGKKKICQRWDQGHQCQEIHTGWCCFSYRLSQSSQTAEPVFHEEFIKPIDVELHLQRSWFRQSGEAWECVFLKTLILLTYSWFTMLC